MEFMVDCNTVINDFKAQMAACENMFGYFSENSEGSPVIAYIEQKEMDDEVLRAEGFKTFYVVKHPEFFDRYLWNEEELYDYLNSHTYGYTFHLGKAVA